VLALLVELHGIDVLQKKDLFCLRKKKEKAEITTELEMTTLLEGAGDRNQGGLFG
jgi:hypothetical protein